MLALARIADTRVRPIGRVDSGPHACVVNRIDLQSRCYRVCIAADARALQTRRRPIGAWRGSGRKQNIRLVRFRLVALGCSIRIRLIRLLTRHDDSFVPKF